jgi:hypothetical protein
MTTWAKVDQDGIVVELVEAAEQPADEEGFSYKEAGNLKVGDSAEDSGYANQAEDALWRKTL